MPLRQLRHVCACGLAHGTSDGDWAYVSRIRVLSTPSVLEIEFGSLQIREIWVHGRIQAHYKLIEIPESDVSWRNFGLSMQSNFNLHARIPKGATSTCNHSQPLRLRSSHKRLPSSVEVTSLTGTHSRREIEIEAPPSSNRSHGGGALQADLGAHAAKPSPGRNSAPHQFHLGLLDQQHPLRDRPRPSVGCALRTRRPAFAMGRGPST